MSESSGGSDDSFLTTKTSVRWELLSSFVAGITILSFVVLMVLSAMGLATLSTIPTNWLILYGGLIVTTTTWVFGKDFASNWRNGE